MAVLTSVAILATRSAGTGGSRDGGSYDVNGGDGRAWAQVSGRLEPGQYTVTATRNGEDVEQSPLEVR